MVPRRGRDPHPLHDPAVEELQALGFGGGEDGEEVHILVAEHPADRPVRGPGQRRVVVQPEAEVRPREPLVEQRRVLPEPGQHGAHDGMDQPFVGQDHPAEEGLPSRRGPKRGFLPVPIAPRIEGPPAEDPALHEVPVDLRRLPDGEVALVHRAVAARR